MDYQLHLIKNTSLSLDTIGIIESYLNAVFILDEAGLYIFDGKSVNIYKTIESKNGKPKYTNLVNAETFGLCLREENKIKYIDFKDDDKIKDVYATPINSIHLIGGRQLYYAFSNTIYNVYPFGSMVLNPGGDPFIFRGNTLICWKEFIISIGGKVNVNSKLMPGINGPA